MPIHSYPAHNIAFPTIIFVESQRWGAISLGCALLLAIEACLLWRKGHAAARPRPWRVFGIVVLTAALGALGVSIWEIWAHIYYTAHPKEVSGQATTAGVALLYYLQTAGQLVATIAAILVGAGLIAFYNAHLYAEERRHLATPARQ